MKNILFILALCVFLGITALIGYDYVVSDYKWKHKVDLEIEQANIVDKSNWERVEMHTGAFRKPWTLFKTPVTRIAIFNQNLYADFGDIKTIPFVTFSKDYDEAGKMEGGFFLIDCEKKKTAYRKDENDLPQINGNFKLDWMDTYKYKGTIIAQISDKVCFKQ